MSATDLSNYPPQIKKANGNGSDSSDDEVDSASPIPQFASNAYRGGRRVSVSAESMAPSSALNGRNVPAEKVVIPKSDDQKQRIKAAVMNNFLFRNLDEEQYKDVVDAMAEKKFNSGDEVIKQGDVGDYFYIVETGTLDVYVQRPSLNNNQPTKVTDYSTGGSFGELALMYNANRAATVKASSDCVLWALDRVTFRRILMDSTSKKRRMYEQFLEEVQLLKGLESYERFKIADALESVTFEDEQVVMKQGDAGDNFYIIESGEAVVLQKNDQGVENQVKHLKKGDYFGELALLFNKPRAATVKAMNGRLKCATLDRKAFDRLLGSVIDIIKRNVSVYRVEGQRKDILDLIAEIENGN